MEVQIPQHRRRKHLTLFYCILVFLFLGCISSTPKNEPCDEDLFEILDDHTIQFNNLKKGYQIEVNLRGKDNLGSFFNGIQFNDKFICEIEKYPYFFEYQINSNSIKLTLLRKNEKHSYCPQYFINDELKPFKLIAKEKMIFSDIRVKSNHLEGKYIITFSNYEFGDPTKESILNKAEFVILNDGHPVVERYQIFALLRDDYERFYSNLKLPKTKRFWESTYGEEYREIFEETKRLVLSDYVYYFTNFEIGPYDEKNGTISLCLGDNRYIENLKDPESPKCIDFFYQANFEGTSVKQCDRFKRTYERYYYHIKLSKDEYNTIEKKRKKLLMRLKFKIIGLTEIDINCVEMKEELHRGTSTPVSYNRKIKQEVLQVTNMCIEFVEKEDLYGDYNIEFSYNL